MLVQTSVRSSIFSLASDKEDGASQEVTMVTRQVKPAPELMEKLEDSILGDTPLEFQTPDSSLVLEAAYVPGQRLLSCLLRAGKVSKWYDYAGFPPTEWVEFYQDSSKGGFFSRRIRPLYQGRPR